MTSARRASRWVWGAIALAVALGALWQFYPLPGASDRMAALPLRGLWVISEDVPLSKVEESIYQSARVVKRVARVQGQVVVLTLIDGTRNRHAVHDPLFCFRGAGWEVLQESSLAVEWGEARRVQLSRRGESGEALYWFTDGQQAFGSTMQYWWRTTLRRMSLGASGREPVLVVITPATDAPVDWAALLHTWPELGAF
jgi:hypothetical protein